MKLVKTVKCKLEVNSQEKQSILNTISKFTQACNDILTIAKEKKIWNRYKLHHLCYYVIKDRYNLTANYVIRAIARVCMKRQRRPKTFKTKSLSLDKDLFRFIEKKESISLATINGRLKLKLSLGNFQRGLLKGQKPTSATLTYQKSKKAFYINFTLEKEITVPSGSNPIGVDRGIYNLATTSNGLKFSGKQVKYIRNHYSKLRQSLQSKGTKGAKKLLRRLSGKERRRMTNINHTISRRIVNACKPNDVLVLEDLKHIRERVKLARKQRLIHHSWAFGQLGSFIEYKALEKGIPVVYVDPHYTSQKCPVCKHIERTNRNGHRFSCKSCGYTEHSDKVASFNIRQVYLDTLADGLSINQPLIAPPLERAKTDCFSRQ